MLTLSKKIIVAIDGSPQSDKAAEEAVRLASISGTRFKSQLYAVMVLPSMKTPSFTDFFPEKPETEMPGWQEKRDRLFYVVEKAAAEADVNLESMVLYGDPAEELMLMAGSREPCWGVSRPRFPCMLIVPSISCADRSDRKP